MSASIFKTVGKINVDKNQAILKKKKKNRKKKTEISIEIIIIDKDASQTDK